MAETAEMRLQLGRDVFDYQQLTACLGHLSKPRDKIHKLLAKGDIVRIRKGLYAFGREYRREPLSREVLANLIYGPSYISLEYALSYHGLIPERVSTVTSVALGRSRKFDTPVGTFTYQSLSLPCYAVGAAARRATTTSTRCGRSCRSWLCWGSGEASSSSTRPSTVAPGGMRVSRVRCGRSPTGLRPGPENRRRHCNRQSHDVGAPRRARSRSKSLTENPNLMTRIRWLKSIAGPGDTENPAIERDVTIYDVWQVLKSGKNLYWAVRLDQIVEDFFKRVRQPSTQQVAFLDVCKLLDRAVVLAEPTVAGDPQTKWVQGYYRPAGRDTPEEIGINVVNPFIADAIAICSMDPIMAGIRIFHTIVHERNHKGCPAHDAEFFAPPRTGSRCQDRSVARTALRKVRRFAITQDVSLCGCVTIVGQQPECRAK